MQLSRSAQMTIAITVGILTICAKGTLVLPLGVPPEIGAYVQSWSNFFLVIYTAAIVPALMAFQSSQPGYLAPPDPPEVVAAAAQAKAKALVMQAIEARAYADDLSSRPAAKAPPPISDPANQPKEG